MYEQTSMISPPQAEAKPAARYYEINEGTARNAHYCVHMSDYQPGSATNGYRTAVDEETVRLRSHIAQFRTMLEEGSPIGRKMDFLVQEFNRESNTIGSKCSDASLAKVVVDLKSEIEKIREQLQNVE